MQMSFINFTRKIIRLSPLILSIKPQKKKNDKKDSGLELKIKKVKLLFKFSLLIFS